MKIVSLAENTARDGYRSVHGLSLYIETPRHRILFDVGPDDTMFRNAARKGIDLTCVDTVVISHGHSDHGGALGRFLQENTGAKVYIQRTAFERHYAKVLFLHVDVSLDPALAECPRLTLLDGDVRIDEELCLFTAKGADPIGSEANRVLCGPRGRDDFGHEMSLYISGEKDVLCMGCGHAGVVNILQSAPARPGVCIGGFHLYNPAGGRTVPEHQLSAVAGALSGYGDVAFYTCHCTGKKAYAYLHTRCPNVSYLSCGEEIEL